MDITVTGLEKSFGEKKVLDHFSYLFQDEKITCIMGESGCGKTTLIRILMGLLKPDKGNVEGMEGKRISAVFQEDRLCENLSAMANVKMVCDKKVGKDEILIMLKQAGLLSSANQPVHELSGGMKRRVAIVRALMAEYDILYLDEPLKGLDPDTKAGIVQLILEKTKGKTVIMITHGDEEAAMLHAEECRMEMKS